MTVIDGSFFARLKMVLKRNKQLQLKKHYIVVILLIIITEKAYMQQLTSPQKV